MTVELCFPIDDATGTNPDFDRLADFLELAAFFSPNCMALTSDLANQFAVGAGEDYLDVDEEIQSGAEEVVSGAVRRIESRKNALVDVYPFELDAVGDLLRYTLIDGAVGQAAYLLSLVLSNLRSLSPILGGSAVHPDDDEVRALRQYFQYFATAAMAAEVRGHSWSFGFPRPDRSGFVGKLTRIWGVLRDGIVEPQIGAPPGPKDDRIDVFAARPHADRLPGFPLATAQVATGSDAAEKSLKGHLGAFKSRWFARQPVTDFVAYMIVPFARSDERFVDDVRTMGNVLHRLRVPRRVQEAESLVAAGMIVEGYDLLAEAVRWVADYRRRAARAA